MAEKILIVDDNAMNRKLLIMILEKKGYILFEAQDGEAAISMATEIMPDLILLDVMMPLKDGYEVCRQLKADDKFAAIPIIFLSAKTETQDKIKGLNLGGSDYMTKPFDQGEVIARVNSQLEIRRLNYNLMEANDALVEKQKLIDADLKAAGAIQQTLLPHVMPDVETLDIAWKFLPCQDIGGDIFNVFRLDESHIAVYMLDVSGHGVPAAMVAVSVSQMLFPHVGFILKQTITPPPYYEICSPAQVLEELDILYPMERFDKYFTMSYMVLNIKTGAIVYSNAAHPHPVIVRTDGSTEFLDKGGTIIGMGGVMPFEEGRAILNPGDRLFLYTDGIPEYQDRNGHFFGEKRFFHQLVAGMKNPLSHTLDDILQGVDTFGEGLAPNDDISLLGIEFKG